MRPILLSDTAYHLNWIAMESAMAAGVPVLMMQTEMSTASVERAVRNAYPEAFKPLPCIIPEYVPYTDPKRELKSTRA